MTGWIFQKMDFPLLSRLLLIVLKLVLKPKRISGILEVSAWSNAHKQTGEPGIAKAPEGALTTKASPITLLLAYDKVEYLATTCRMQA